MTRRHSVENVRLGIRMDATDLAHAGHVIEVCREHVLNVAMLAQTTANMLCQCFTYEATEPHLGHSCLLVYDVLEQVARALEPLTLPIPGRDPLHLAAACEVQRRQLLAAQAVIRAMEFVSRNTFDCRRSTEREIRDVLLDIDDSLQTSISALGSATLGLPAAH